MRAVEQGGKQHAGLAEPMVVTLQAGKDEIGLLLLNGCGERLRRAKGIPLGELVVGDVNASVGTLRERFLDRLLHALRSHRKGDNFPTVFFLEPQCFLERVAVGLVHLKADVGFLDPVSGDRQRRIFRGDLLDTHDDVHGFLPLPALQGIGCLSGAK